MPCLIRGHAPKGSGPRFFVSPLPVADAPMPAPLLAALNAVKPFVEQLWPIIVAAAIAGSAWQRTEMQLENKVDVVRFQLDSARSDVLLDEVRGMRATMNRIDDRLSEIYCAGKPAGCR